jgi:hypothetical protein
MADVSGILKKVFYQPNIGIPYLSKGNVSVVVRMKIGPYYIWAFHPKHEERFKDEIEKIGLEPEQFNWKEYFNTHDLPIPITSNYDIMRLP